MNLQTRFISASLCCVILPFWVSYSLAESPKHETCTTSSCHGSIMAGGGVHGPVKMKNCSTCHQAGEGGSKNLKLPKSHPTLSAIKPEAIKPMCLRCHNTQNDIIKNAKHVHSALKDGACTDCHNPHSSQHKNLLNDSMPALCYSCHSELETQSKSDKTTHGALTIQESCANCHDPHASKQAKLLKNTQPALCLDCHSKPIKTKNGKMITNIGDLLKNSSWKHSALEAGSCTDCHQPHSSKNRSLLSKQYTDKTYTPFDKADYELCFSCHDPELATAAKTSEQTGFRNGDQNLHYLHIQGTRRAKQGRSCNVCHEVHASKHPKLIKSFFTRAFTSGETQIPIIFEESKNGGSCATACHGLKKYDRNK